MDGLEYDYFMNLKSLTSRKNQENLFKLKIEK